MTLTLFLLKIMLTHIYTYFLYFYNLSKEQDHYDPEK